MPFSGLSKSLAGAVQRPILTIPRTSLRAAFLSHPSPTPAASLHSTTFTKALRTPPMTSSPLQRRARLGPNHQSTPISAAPPTATATRSIFIQTEPTPNEDALKFLPNQNVIPEDFPTKFLEYLSPRSTLQPPYPSPLASKLINVEGVSAVSFGPDFITIEKQVGTNWAHIKPEVFSLITEAVTQGAPLVNTAESARGGAGAESSGEQELDSLAYNEEDDEVVSMIKELLDTRIRPAIQEDGGDIEFRGFEDGTVFLKLRGACRTCDSSTATLKTGIEGMLMHYIEEVQAVEQIQDEEEAINMHEFAKFEEKLRQQQEENKKRQEQAA